MRIRTKAVPTMRAEEFFDSVYEFCRAESQVKHHAELYLEGMKRCMFVIRELNMIVKSTQEVDAELLKVVFRTIRRHVNAKYEIAIVKTLDWMRRITGLEGVSI